MFQHVFSKALEAEKTHDFSLAGGGYHIILVHILYHLRDSRKNVSALLTGESSLFLKYLKNYFCEYINNYLLPGLPRHKNLQHKNLLPGDFLLNHITYSFVGLLMWWIKNDWQNLPEEMAQYFEKTKNGAAVNLSVKLWRDDYGESKGLFYRHAYRLRRIEPAAETGKTY